MTTKTIAVLGVGPGLGMSVARRFAAEGWSLALVSRTDARHAGYRAELAGAPVHTYAADLTDPDALAAVVGRAEADLGGLGAVYYGPAAAMPGIVPLPQADAPAVAGALDVMLLPAVRTASLVLPGMLARGDGALLYAVGLSGLRPLPMLGTLAPASAALRMYALTLHAALADQGVYVGALTIGGLIERGDIHAMLTAAPGAGPMPTLNPDDLAERAWRMVTDRAEAEAVFDLLPPQFAHAD